MPLDTISGVWMSSTVDLEIQQFVLVQLLETLQNPSNPLPKLLLRLLKPLFIVRRMSTNIKYFDIGVNFTDPMFEGQYHGRQAHPSDLEDVIERAKLFNVKKMMLTGSSLKESKHTLDFAKKYEDGSLYTTVGVHPCTVNEINDDNELQYLQDLKSLALEGKKSGIVKSFGEIGLDYDRLHYTPRDHQLKYFEKQLHIAVEVQLPLFLHMRAANEDFIKTLKPFLPQLPKGGVVHSFTGTVEELNALLELGLYIGVNGCSLKTEENLQVIKEIPLEKLMIETDAPWCEIRKTHAGYKYLTPYPNETYPEVPVVEEKHDEEKQEESSLGEPPQLNKKGKEQQPQKKTQNALNLDPLLPFPLVKKEHFAKYDPSNKQLTGQLAAPLVKSRNEPVHVGQVVEIIAKVKGVPIAKVVEHAWENTVKVFEIEE